MAVHPIRIHNPFAPFRFRNPGVTVDPALAAGYSSDMSSVYRQTAPSVAAAVSVVFAAALAACGPNVEPVDTAQVIERDRDARVLVFVRDVDGIPRCPWEVLGEIAVKPGWTADDGDRRRVERAAAKLGGHAVMVDDDADESARVLRFFDPLCNPLDDE